jgi:Mn-dependent DtxR family transcriptional regulator
MQLHDQKLESIIALLKEEPYWTSKDIAEKLKISRSTVQKCLQELHEENIVQRVTAAPNAKTTITQRRSPWLTGSMLTNCPRKQFAKRP